MPVADLRLTDPLPQGQYTIVTVPSSGCRNVTSYRSDGVEIVCGRSVYKSGASWCPECNKMFSQTVRTYAKDVNPKYIPAPYSR
jgi:hypothetical protein